jgi:hypothetical protein
MMPKMQGQKKIQSLFFEFSPAYSLWTTCPFLTYKWQLLSAKTSIWKDPRVIKALVVKTSFSVPVNTW